MKFTVMSDLHGEIDFINDLPDQKDTILLVPGDIEESHRKKKYFNAIEIMSSKFKEVLMVPGNHEYYNSNITKTHRILKEIDNQIDNFHVLQNDFRIFDDVLILGGTLWTDFDGSNPLTKYHAKLAMNDFRFIRHGPEEEYWNHKLTPDEVEFFHYETKEFLKKALDNQRKICENVKTVVMSHHAPSFGSVSPKYIGDSLNGCYCSNMDYFVDSLNVDVWVHGHVHTSHDYMIGNTRVLCNPLGYFEMGTFENKTFNSTLSFEV